jgi:hypothetical protein
MALTDTTIRNAKPGERPVRLFDGGGLYLEVSPTGGKWWRLKYRFNGKEKRLSLGVYSDVSLKDARDRRDASRKLLANGIDPSENRKAMKSARADLAANSFEMLAREWFAKFSATWAANHSDRIVRRFERDIFPWIGTRPITEVTAQELLSVVRRIESRGALETARRALGNCGQVFRYATATGRADRDLSIDLRGALSPVKGEHFAATTEPKRVAEILRAMDGYEGTLTVRCALRLAPLVFVRPGELRRAILSLSISTSLDGKVLVQCHAGCNQPDVITALQELGLWKKFGKSAKLCTRQQQYWVPDAQYLDIVKRTEAALAIWQASQSAEGTPVETYLRSRGLNMSAPSTIRFHSGLMHPSGGVWRAMVALVTNSADATPMAIHRTFLHHDGSSKTSVHPQKMMLGPCRGGAVRLAAPGDELMVGEGIEMNVSRRSTMTEPFGQNSPCIHRYFLPSTASRCLLRSIPNGQQKSLSPPC